ncbi:MAG: hypothetical protein ACXVXP_04025 [Mycobacteriaceae bacterium]
MVISPYTCSGVVLHTRCDLLSVVRSAELILGMDPLTLNDAFAPHGGQRRTGGGHPVAFGPRGEQHAATAGAGRRSRRVGRDQWSGL